MMMSEFEQEPAENTQDNNGMDFVWPMLSSILIIFGAELHASGVPLYAVWSIGLLGVVGFSAAGLFTMLDDNHD
jgi:hypothetical protein